MKKEINKILNEKFSSKKDLINRLEKQTLVLGSENIKNALNKIDRADFVSEDYLCEAYEDYPLPIGYDQTISQPTTVVFMLELLDVRKGNKVLDIGSGSGWTTALLSEIVGEKGSVVGFEIIPELLEIGKSNLAKYNFKNSKITEPEKIKEKYDRILVSAAFKNKIPKELVNSLKEGGVLVAPVDDKVCKIIKGRNDRFNQYCHQGFNFVPYIYEK